MDTQFTASEHLDGPGHVYRSTICALHCVERCSEPLRKESNMFQAYARVNQAD